jgi:hypothetical protein
MPDLNADQLKEITYISGVDAGGIVASDSFAVWKQQNSRDTIAYAAKWGEGKPVPGLL